MVVLIIVCVLLITALVLFNIFPLKKNKEQPIKKSADAEASQKAEQNKKQENTQKQEKQAKEKKNNIKDLFNKKDENKKKKITCPSCGVEVEVYDGDGRCPYCGAKFVKK